jgi:hypothetical protein
MSEHRESSSPFAPTNAQLDDWRMSITSDIAEVKTSLDVLVKTLMGNGQPGALSKIDRRLAALESAKNKLAGAIAVAGVLLGWIVRGHITAN